MNDYCAATTAKKNSAKLPSTLRIICHFATNDLCDRRRGRTSALPKSMMTTRRHNAEHFKVSPCVFMCLRLSHVFMYESGKAARLQISAAPTAAAAPCQRAAKLKACERRARNALSDLCRQHLRFMPCDCHRRDQRAPTHKLGTLG